ncbi:armadillo-type protein [Myxozyma melibiosi]|uniref:Armadillo-type protein n=1 Tax=Myxozyma melibiosi TaxID=54550 RepID=A0ABR1FBK2_9ASCO
MADQEVDYSTLPITERVVHKIWKVRLAAYEEITKQFTTSGSENDPCFRPFLSDPTLYKKIVTDSNVAAQEAGIGSLVAFLQYGGTNACQRLRGTVVAPLAEKGLVSMRGGTKQKTVDALLYFIELDTPDPVVEEILPILSNKLPKLVAGTTMALREIIKAFGTKTVPPKSILKALPKLFAHSDKNVRAEATTLAIELYKWMGDPLKTILLTDLKPVQQKELEEAFEAVKGTTPQQERFLLSQQRAAASAAASSGPDAGDSAAPEAEEIDPMDLIEAVDVSGKIPGDFFERMASAKWKDRKEAVDDLLKVVSVAKIADADFGEVMRVLGKCVAKDANVAVVTTAANSIEALAKGLRTSCGRYRASVSSSLFERLKEKKQSVSEALSAALDALFEATSLSDFMEEILSFTKHKNPQVKQETAMFLVRCLRTVKIIPKTAEIKQLCDACTVLLADTAKPVRSAGAEAMGTIMKMIGERAMTPYISELDDIRKTMITEFYETATVVAKPEKVAAPPPPAPAAKTSSASSRSATARPRPSVAGVKRPTATPPSSGSHSTSSAPAASSSSSSGSRLAAPGSRTSRIGMSNGLRKKTEDSSATASPRTVSRAPAATSGTPPRGSRGLTGVSLSSSNSTSSHGGLSAADKLELIELRRAKEEWTSTNAALKQQVEILQADNAKLDRELKEAQASNSQLIEEHTRDLLSVQSKETQITRLRREADSAVAQVTKLQRELDRARAEAQLVGRPSSSHSNGAADHHDMKESSMSPYQARQSTTAFSEEEKENDFQRIQTPAAKRESMYSGGSHIPKQTSFSPVMSSNSDGADSGSSNAGTVESWKRAAEVTSQLKARIEAMKAKQLRR